MKTVGLFGLTFHSENKGCSALAHSFLEILANLYKDEKIKVMVFTEGGNKPIENKYNNLDIESVRYRFKDLKTLVHMKQKIKQCNYVFDFTEGDSFSDIYGIKRMIKVSFTKLMTISGKVPLILGPQTYGPFKSKMAQRMAKKIIKKSYYVCARDIMSAEKMKEQTGREIDSYTDIAFALPQAEVEYSLEDKPKLGINVSALLWNGGYNGENQFVLALDYKEYITKLIEKIVKENKYQVHLIPHVITSIYDNVENDYKICKQLEEKFESVVAAPPFDTPMEAKNYIAYMKIFTGARMHATIGAFSSEVVTIPFSYSPKFEGLYNGVGYPYVIHGKTMNTEEAVEKTLEYIKNSEELKNKQQNSMKLINDKLGKLYKKLSEITK